MQLYLQLFITALQHQLQLSLEEQVAVRETYSPCAFKTLIILLINAGFTLLCQLFCNNTSERSGSFSSSYNNIITIRVPNTRPILSLIPVQNQHICGHTNLLNEEPQKQQRSTLNSTISCICCSTILPSPRTLQCAEFPLSIQVKIITSIQLNFDFTAT